MRKTVVVTYILNMVMSSVIFWPLDSIRIHAREKPTASEFIPERNPLNVMNIRKYFDVKLFIDSCKSVLEYIGHDTFFSLFSYLSPSWGFVLE